MIVSGLFFCADLSAQDSLTLPRTVYVGGQAQHVQGIAYDSLMNCMYMSFTSRFLKVDMTGNVLASIDRIQGHLGAMTFNPEDRKVYASLECKDDEIGQGIAKVLNVEAVSKSASRFYIAVIDVDRLDGIGMDPENNDVLRTVCIRKAVEDYSYSGEDGVEHKYGCSGIDGVTVGPEVKPVKDGRNGEKQVKRGGEKYLYVGYGIYGDIDREDNDYQVIQRYSLKKLNSLARPVIFGESHEAGPKKPEREYFVFTGNTRYGVQNLAYDSYTGCMFMAVYAGKKPQYPNYDLFAFSVCQKPEKSVLKGGADGKRHLTLRLVQCSDDQTPGYRFRWGSTGLCPLGGGLWYISENGKNKAMKTFDCTARLYHWTGSKDGQSPFSPVE